MLKHLLHLIIISFTVVNMQAQEFMIQAVPGCNYIYETKNLPKYLEGSPYLDDWKSSDIIFKNGDTISNLMVRINIYRRQIQYKFNDQIYIIGAPDSISQIKVANKVYISKECTKDRGTEKYLFEIVSNGKVTLLNRYEIEIMPSNYNVALDIGDRNDHLALKQQLFLQKGEQLVALNRKTKLHKVLNDKSKEVFDYMDREDLSSKKKEDVIKVIEYYNKL